MSAEPDGSGNGIPALFDIMRIGFGKSVRKADHTVLQFCALDIADAIEGRPFPSSKFANAGHDGLDHIRFGGGKFFAVRQIVDSGVYADGEQLVLGGGGVGHG